MGAYGDVGPAERGSSDRGPSYILGTGDDELVRLGFQHRMWHELAAGAWERAGFGLGGTLLDVGCGPGYTTLDLAELVGAEGRVIGVDQSPRFVEYLRARAEALGLSNVEALHGDVADLELPLESVDGAYARWVLCFVTHPDRVIAAVARALRPGGAFAVQDYVRYVGMTIAPRMELTDRVISAIAESWKERGGDPDVGCRLPRLMADSGLEVRDIRPIARIGRPHAPFWQWPTTFWRNYLPVLVGFGAITEADARGFQEEWDRRGRDPNAFFLSPPMVEIIAVKA